MLQEGSTPLSLAIYALSSSAAYNVVNAAVVCEAHFALRTPPIKLVSLLSNTGTAVKSSSDAHLGVAL